MFVAFACRHPAAARSNLMGGPRYSFSFVTKREAEKSRYFRGAGHGSGAIAPKNPAEEKH